MNTLVKLTVLSLLLSLAGTLPALARGNGPGRGGAGTPPIVSVAPLAADEAATLTWMREEEKLARDVYQALYASTRARIFKNIAASEQRHMDALLKKLNRFGLPDPALSGTGVFSVPELQTLYTALVQQGQASYTAALRVGATIEDLDIFDLMTAIEETDNVALRTTYQNLLEGSKNHLRAFVGRLNQAGESYEPQYIDRALYDAILGL